MHGGPGRFLYVILIIFLLIDLYTFKGIKSLSNNLNNGVKWIIYSLYWLVPVIIIILTFVIQSNVSHLGSGDMFNGTFYLFVSLMVLFYVPKIIFSAFELGNDLVNGLIFLTGKIHASWQIPKIHYFRYTGAVFAALIFFFTFYGIVHGRYHYKVNHIPLSFSNLPSEFDGFKIVQISDWHIGSYKGKPQKIMDAVDRINALDADVILFTGDLVNNLASEVEEFEAALKHLSSKYGVYSVLGNHDYGDYVQWSSQEARDENINKLIKIEENIGFKLLNNNSVIIERDNAKIGLAGVENWGVPPFPQHGDLDSALKNINDIPFKILMSHDPSHWKSQVIDNTDVDLTLSGHTHGMQFGIKFKNFQWSPVKMRYPNWAGLYSHNNQILYVNVGIGYIAFPGRVGIRPEITVIELQVKK